MDLPTYTSIWRIEKRLYKLYDFRLPMPLPIGQITVFAAIAVPYVLLLTLLVPFNHSLIWLYVLPPGVATWLVTRPVLESKRLPELIGSQVRYLAEPRVWCRMAPLAESEVVVVTGRVWRLPPAILAQIRGSALARKPWQARLASRRPSPASAVPASPGAAVLAPPAQVRVAREWPAQAPSAQGQPVQDQSPAWPPVQAKRARSRSGRAEPGAMEAGIAVSGLGRARPGQPGLTRPRPTRDGLAQGGPLTTPGRLAATRPPAPVVPQLAPGYQPPVPVVPPLAVDSPQDHQGGYQTRLMRSPTAPPTRPAPELAANVARESADAVAPDLTGPELAAPDLADPGLALPRIAVPGLAGPDPAVPDPAVPDQAASGPTGPAGAGPEPVIRPASSDPLVTDPLVTEPVIAPSETAEPAVATALPLAAPAVPSAGDGARTSVTVVSQAASPEPVLPVERAIADPSARRNDGRTGRVAVVPGGHRPGKPDQLQRDRARALLAIEGHRSAIVLGCTVGAGQTTTALLTGEVLASLRSDPIAVLDLNPGPESLARRALKRPALAQATAPMRSSLIVLGGGAADESGRPADPAVATSEFARAASAHRLVITDPSTVLVPRLIALADQLILVAPASAAAARAIGMTLEWLDAHGEPGLATSAIMVMNGVSRRSLAHVEAAERVCMGRCRAIVRIPWDDQLKADQAKAAQGRTGLLSPGTVSAYTALAGVLVTALAGSDRGQADDGDSTGRGPR